MLKVLNIGKGKAHGGATQRARTTAGRATHDECLRDCTAAKIAQMRPFLF